MLTGLPLYAYSLFAVFCAYFVKGLSGFANTLVFSSVMGFAADTHNISPTDLLLGLPSNLYLAWRERRSVRWREVVILSALVLTGMIPGTLLLKVGNDQALKVLLGAAVAALGIEMLLRCRHTGPMAKPHPLVLLVIGLGSGVLCGLFGISAFLVAYIARTTSTQSQARGTMCCVFALENLMRMVLYLSGGILTWEIAKGVLSLLPAVAVGLWAGLRASRRIPESRAKQTVSVLLILSGGSLILTNLLA